MNGCRERFFFYGFQRQIISPGILWNYMEAEFTSFVIGLLNAASPCILPLYPGFLAYLSGGQVQRLGRTRIFIGFFILLGVLSMMLLLGGVIALASVAIGKVLTLVIPLASAVLICLGILLLANINVFSRMPLVQVTLVERPFASAFIYGLLYGPLALPCSGALVVSIFTLSLTIGDAIGKLFIFLWFGLGIGLPLLIMSLLAAGAQRWITHGLARYSGWMNRIAGILLVGVGLYNFVINWDNFRLMLAAAFR
jgi:cytochrome c-type biogenesis protein